MKYTQISSKIIPIQKGHVSELILQQNNQQHEQDHPRDDSGGRENLHVD